MALRHERTFVSEEKRHVDLDDLVLETSPGKTRGQIETHRQRHAGTQPHLLVQFDVCARSEGEGPVVEDVIRGLAVGDLLLERRMRRPVLVTHFDAERELREEEVAAVQSEHEVCPR